MAPTPEQDALLQRIIKQFDQADKGAHKRFRQRADHFYALYSNYTEWRGSIGTDRRDRDNGLKDAQREWGAELFIPFSFSTVETVIPRMLAASPRVLVKPRREQWQTNAYPMKLTIDAQMANIDYELRLQDIARDALIAGLGVQKTYWATRKAQVNQLERGQHHEWIAVPKNRTLFDDPVVERVDPYDWFWDPFACEVQECDYIVHRNWRSTSYVKKLLDQKIWTYPKDSRDLTEGAGGGEKYSEAWSQRMTIDGTRDFKASGDVHEVWEWHDGEQVVTVLNRECIVQQGKNPAWHGEFPFQVYRPTRRPGKMVGRGEIEPIEDLQEEINTMRSQRRDNATVALARSFFFSDGMIDPGDFKMGPGLGIPVLGDPREVVFPVPISDIPNSGYQEEASLMADIMRTTGVDDTASGAGNGVQQTATGTQLVYQAQSGRIKQKTKGLEIELVRGAGRQMMALNQQKIRDNREVAVPSTPMPGEPDHRWAWMQIGPGELAGEFELEVEGGSLAPENVPQQRQDSQTWLGLAQNPAINPQFAMRMAVKNLGIDDPEVALAPAEPQIPAQSMQQFAQILQSAGVDPGLLSQAQHAVMQPQEKK